LNTPPYQETPSFSINSIPAISRNGPNINRDILQEPATFFFPLCYLVETVLQSLEIIDIPSCTQCGFNSHECGLSRILGRFRLLSLHLLWKVPSFGTELFGHGNTQGGSNSSSPVIEVCSSVLPCIRLHRAWWLSSCERARAWLGCLRY
jgi:hypothetical protein